MPKYDVDIDGRVLFLRRTFSGRVIDALHRFATTLPLTVLSIGVIFGIEWLGRQPPDEELPIYIGSTFFIGGLISLAFGLTRLLRNDLWVIDLSENLLAFETAMPWGQARGAAIPLEDVSEFRLVASGTRLELIALVEGEEEVVASAGVEQMNEVVAKIEGFAVAKGTPLEIVRAPGM